MTSDFSPGDTIFYTSSLTSRRNGPYIVLDPVRTKAGKLRVKGPRGGNMTTWWSKNSLYPKLEFKSGETS